MNAIGRMDFHTHTFLSDGTLLPSELLRRAAVKGYVAVGITDHADGSNIVTILEQLCRLAAEYNYQFGGVSVLPGVELTHVPPERIAPLARKAKELGAALVVVHGETIVEPVAEGTNEAAVRCPDVDILGHPGFVTLEQARIAASNGIFLEITSRGGHNQTNGHVAKVARAGGASLLVNTDAHSSADLMDLATARRIAEGAGLESDEVERANTTNARALWQRALKRVCTR